MTTKEIFEAAADYIEHNNLNLIVYPLYQVTDYSFPENTRRAMELVRDRIEAITDEELLHWAATTDSKKIADTLRSIAKEYSEEV